MVKLALSQKPEHTTGGSRRGAQQGGGADSGRTVCQKNCSPQKRSFFALSKAMRTRCLKVPKEIQTNEFQCKPMAEESPHLTTGSSAVYQWDEKRFLFWLPTSGTAPSCLCKPFLCKACQGTKKDDQLASSRTVKLFLSIGFSLLTEELAHAICFLRFCSVMFHEKRKYNKSWMHDGVTKITCFVGKPSVSIPSCMAKPCSPTLGPDLTHQLSSVKKYFIYDGCLLELRIFWMFRYNRRRLSPERPFKSALSPVCKHSISFLLCASFP